MSSFRMNITARVQAAPTAIASSKSNSYSSTKKGPSLATNRPPTREVKKTYNTSTRLGDVARIVPGQRQHIRVQQNTAEKPNEDQPDQHVPCVRKKVVFAGTRPPLITSDTGLECTLNQTSVNTVPETIKEQRLDNVDQNDNTKKNYLMVPEYIEDIMTYKFLKEKEFPIHPQYLSLESRQINARMRGVLLDWLVEVHSQFNYAAETLYLCGKLLDRYLMVDKTVLRENLQLVGVTALYLAAKYEEVCTPAMRDFSAICDNAFSVKSIRRMECKMVMAIDFDFSCPLPCEFLRRFSKAAKADLKLHSLAKYIMELSIIDYTVIDLLPSTVAASALAIALMILEKKPLRILWTPTIEHYSTYSFERVRSPAIQMAYVLARAQDEQTKFKAVKTKFGRSKPLLCISSIEDLNLGNWKQRVLEDLSDEHLKQWPEICQSSSSLHK